MVAETTALRERDEMHAPARGCQGQEGLMKVSDTIGLVLKSKGETASCRSHPSIRFYEAIKKMAEHNIGALL